LLKHVQWDILGKYLANQRRGIAMPRTVVDSKLGSRTARALLKARGKPYWRSLGGPLCLGYRKGQNRTCWLIRIYLGSGKYRMQALDGMPDDLRDADGSAVLSFAQAQEQARKMATSPAAGLVTVAQAIERYLAFLRAERRTGADAQSRLGKHVLPRIGARPVAQLTQTELEQLRWSMIRRDPADPEVERKSQDSCNRVLAYLRAALNRCHRDPDAGVPSDQAWRAGLRPFRGVSRPRMRFLNPVEVRRLLAACDVDPALQQLLTVGLLTGCRLPHELVGARIADFSPELGTLAVDGKTGPRSVTLSSETITYLSGLVAGCPPGDFLLPGPTGAPWRTSEPQHCMARAVKRAGLPTDVTLYTCRHTYISQCMMAGMNLKLLAENCGTSIGMIEKTYAKFSSGSRRELIEQTAFRLGFATNVTPLRRA
jgi:integrase